MKHIYKNVHETVVSSRVNDVPFLYNMQLCNVLWCSSTQLFFSDYNFALRPFSIAVVLSARVERTCFNFCYRCLIWAFSVVCFCARRHAWKLNYT